MFELFIAKRYLTGRHKFGFIRILSLLSIGGITVGVAALVIVLSIFNGFRSLVSNSLLNFDPHIQISMPESKEDINSVLQSNESISSFSDYVEGKVVLTNGRNFEVVSLRGTQNFRDKIERIKRHFISRIEPQKILKGNKILLGLPLALKLGLRVGDTLKVISAKDLEKSAVTLSLPQSHEFVLAGIFEINNKKLAYSTGFTNLESAQKTLGLRNKINGIEVYLNSFDDAEKIKNELKNELNGDVKIFTWYDLHKDLYSVMQLETWAAYLLLSLIILVAVFNILTSLTMSVIEKRKDIAILRAIGGLRKSILRIFMFEGFLAGVIGTILGLALGLIICWVQIEFKIYSLDPRKYIIDALPVLINSTDIILIGIMSFALTFLAAIYPAKQALKLNIIDSLKWE